MPGRLIMDSSGAQGPQDVKKDRSKAQAAEPESKETMAHVNGTNAEQQKSSLTNGVPSHSTINGGSTDATAASTQAGEPPKLDQEWRSSDANKSMGVLLERLAQQCYSDLNDTITKMAETAAPSQGSQPNGVAPNASESLEISLYKKRTLMEFAKDQRDRFIKTLVLSDWARNSEDMAKLVDIKVWQEKQTNAQNNAIWFIGQLKRDLSTSKIPSPNIGGALEFLSTGKASRYPSMGYLPPKRLTAKQLLRTLQDMNVTLSVRLNVDEKLPPHFNNFTIRDGRATFKVANEFEVELSVADDDTSSQFYFIDLRFLFSPAALQFDERIRPTLELRANAALAARGLLGCYELLHNYVLSYKVQVLHDQAAELLHGKWFGCLRIEKKGRVLTIQYFAGLRGPKSWIEIGVGTGKQTNVRTRKPPTPQLFARWVRKKGSVVQAEQIDFDVQVLNVEDILTKVIAKHAASRLEQIRDRLEAVAGAESKLNMQLTTSSIPDECSLDLAVPDLPTSLTIQIETYTGRLAIAPSTPLTARYENGLNSEVDPDFSRHLVGLVCHCMQERVNITAQLVDWDHCLVIQPPNLRTSFGVGVLAVSFFVCNPAWRADWILAATFSARGVNWMIARTEPQLDERGRQSRFILTVQQIAGLVDTSVTKPSIDRSSLLRIEKLAAQEVAWAGLSRQLTVQHIEHRFGRLRLLVKPPGPCSSAPAPSAVLDINASQLLDNDPDQGKHLKPIGTIRISHLGVENHGILMARYELRLNLQPGTLPHLQERLSASRDPEISMNEAGSLAVRFSTPFGQPSLDQIKGRLKSCQHLDNYLTILASRGWRTTSMSLTNLTFVYHKEDQLSASVTLDGYASVPVALVLEPENNPHARLRHYLQSALKGHFGNSDPFQMVCAMLEQTLPVMRTFDTLETKHSVGKTLDIKPRSLVSYRLAYCAPLSQCSFQLDCAPRNENGQTKLIWNLWVKSFGDRGHVTDDLKTAWKEICQQKTAHWTGIDNGGLVADMYGVADAIVEADEMVRKFEGVETTGPTKIESPSSQQVKREASADPTTQPDAKPSTHLQPAQKQKQGPRQADLKPVTSGQLKTPAQAQMQRSTAPPQRPASAAPAQQQMYAAAAQMQRSGSAQAHPTSNLAAPANMQRSGSAQQHQPVPSGVGVQMQRSASTNAQQQRRPQHPGAHGTHGTQQQQQQQRQNGGDSKARPIELD